MNCKRSTAFFGFKVLTANIHKGFSPLNRRFVLPQLREALQQAAPDVVFLQEVIGHESKHCQQSHYEFLADRIWPEHAYGRNAVYTKGHHGNAMLSKFSITHRENHNISLGGLQQRGLLHCTLQLPHGKQLHTICVHLSLQESHRRRQLHMLCQVIASEVPANAPLIVAGDFNDWRQRAHSILAHEAGLQEVFVQGHGLAAQTFPARWPVLRLDRIYTRGLINQQPLPLAHQVWSHLSDHVPLAAQVEVETDQALSCKVQN